MGKAGQRSEVSGQKWGSETVAVVGRVMGAEVKGLGGGGEGALFAGEDEGFGDGFELFPALADHRGLGGGDLVVGGGGGDGGEEVGEVLDNLVEGGDQGIGVRR